MKTLRLLIREDFGDGLVYDFGMEIRALLNMTYLEIVPII